ncbi:NAD(P)-dependent oxidoreductase [Rufibacter sp. LB8]|uniref:NAD-dependent epimerase/dehydratase family protein n=1 Tax=Rufibacter sp. LB8 TaxID=2777781 RepID=UPI00178C6DFD|nr:NAD(P)-dependent oxidoreductase [Rufibacter sp. LB8]
MSVCILFGGAGFVGTHLATFLLATKRFDHVHIADILPSPLAGKPQISTSITDVRNPIPLDLTSEKPVWVFNLAAIHREPGHKDAEYYETNIAGAKNVLAYTEAVGCQHLYFTSSIAVYGPALVPTGEEKTPNPTSAYGISKLEAERLHQLWQTAAPNRKLVISRPGVIYGPGDPGNIMRMIKAIRRGYFAFPGSKDIHKSYAYIYGFLDSIAFCMDRPEPLLVYNYVETPTETIDQITRQVKRHFNSKAPILSLPSSVLVPISSFLQLVAGSKNPIHPVRVKKAGTPTYILPSKLLELGFEFKYDFGSSIKHWQAVAPEDFI